MFFRSLFILALMGSFVFPFHVFARSVRVDAIVSVLDRAYGQRVKIQNNQGLPLAFSEVEENADLLLSQGLRFLVDVNGKSLGILIRSLDSAGDQKRGAISVLFFKDHSFSDAPLHKAQYEMPRESANPSTELKALVAWMNAEIQNAVAEKISKRSSISRVGSKIINMFVPSAYSDGDAEFVILLMVGAPIAAILFMAMITKGFSQNDRDRWRSVLIPFLISYGALSCEVIGQKIL